MFVVVARWTIKDEQVDEALRLIREMIPHALAEPACEAYAVNQSLDDPRQVLLYEVYHDEAGFQAHQETEAFQRIVLGQIRPLLADRGRDLYTLIEP